MWESYRDRYRLRGRVLSFSRVGRELPNLRRFRLVVVDESHNLRNRERKRYRTIQEYVRTNESSCILLSATPYNKTYLDLANQLRLFIPEDRDIGIRPERLLQDIGETEFIRRHQCSVRTLAAFEKSEYADDWRELMRLFLVRRTRSFIQDNYAETDPATGRKFLTFEDGTRSYFPTRLPRTVQFALDENDPADQYARLYSDPIVEAINKLTLPRYGLGNYVTPSPAVAPSSTEGQGLAALSRAGKRLMGFCRTNLFKRLESSGQAFLQSVERHILRNFIVLHAITNGLPLPIGTQEAELLDPQADAEDALYGEPEDADADEEEADANAPGSAASARLRTETDFESRAAEVYQEYAGRFRHRFRWLRPSLFIKELARDLRKDNRALLGVLRTCGDWNPARDAKLNALEQLLTEEHPGKKILVFSQFADTVRYLEGQVRARGSLASPP